MLAPVEKARIAFAAVQAADEVAQRERRAVSKLKIRHQQAIATRERLREEKDREAALRLLSVTEESSDHG